MLIRARRALVKMTDAAGAALMISVETVSGMGTLVRPTISLNPAICYSLQAERRAAFLIQSSMVETGAGPEAPASLEPAFPGPSLNDASFVTASVILALMAEISAESIPLSELVNARLSSSLSGSAKPFAALYTASSVAVSAALLFAVLSCSCSCSGVSDSAFPTPKADFSASSNFP